MKPRAFLLENVPMLAGKKNMPYFRGLLKRTLRFDNNHATQIIFVSNPMPCRMNKTKLYDIRWKARLLQVDEHSWETHSKQTLPKR